MCEKMSYGRPLLQHNMCPVNRDIWNVLSHIFPLLHVNDTPAVPPATGFDVKIHLFDTSNFFCHVG